MSLSVVSGFIDITNVISLVTCNRIIRFSNARKPEALITVLDSIFHEGNDIYSVNLAMVNCYCFLSIFFEKIHYSVELFVSFIFVALFTQVFLLVTQLFLLMLLHIYQMAYLLDRITPSMLLWIVRVFSSICQCSIFKLIALLSRLYYASSSGAHG